jgi:hypothetical protein
MRLSRYENFIVLLVLSLVLAGPIWGDGASDTGPVAFTDYGSFLGEYQAAGALKFYNNTEAILRLAQFEQALMRYRFLKGQIRGKGDYTGLLNMVDLRLRFLQKQLHLRDVEIAAIPPRKVRIPLAKPPEAKPPPEKPPAAKPKVSKDADEDKEKGGPSISGTFGPPEKAAAPPMTAAQKPPEVVTTTPETKDEKAEEEKNKEEAKPAPPLSYWQRLKNRLHWKKKAAEQ